MREEAQTGGTCGLNACGNRRNRRADLRTFRCSRHPHLRRPTRDLLPFRLPSRPHRPYPTPHRPSLRRVPRLWVPAGLPVWRSLSAWGFPPHLIRRLFSPALPQLSLEQPASSLRPSSLGWLSALPSTLSSPSFSSQQPSCPSAPRAPLSLVFSSWPSNVSPFRRFQITVPLFGHHLARTSRFLQPR